MIEKEQPRRLCPICRAAMVRVSTDDSQTIYHCYSCNAEIVVRSANAGDHTVPPRSRT